MPIEKWSDQVIVIHLGDDPQFSDDLAGLGQIFDFSDNVTTALATLQMA